MDRRTWLGYAAVAGGLLLVGYALFSRAGDDELIRVRLGALARAVSSTEPASNVLFRASFLKEQFEELLAQDVRIDVPEVGRLPSDPRSLALATARLQAAQGTFEVVLGDISIEVSDGRATAEATAYLTAPGARGEGARNVQLTLSKDSGSWLVTGIRVMGLRAE